MCKYLCATLVITSIDVYAPSSMSPSPSFSIVLYLFISIALLTARAFQKRSRPRQLTLCRSLHAEALQAAASEELVQGPFVAARTTNVPPRPTQEIESKRFAEGDYNVTGLISVDEPF